MQWGGGAFWWPVVPGHPSGVVPEQGQSAALLHGRDPVLASDLLVHQSSHDIGTALVECPWSTHPRVLRSTASPVSPPRGEFGDVRGDPAGRLVPPKQAARRPDVRHPSGTGPRTPPRTPTTTAVRRPPSAVDNRTPRHGSPHRQRPPTCRIIAGQGVPAGQGLVTSVRGGRGIRAHETGVTRPAVSRSSPSQPRPPQ